MKKIEKQLERSFNEYYNTVEKLASDEFNRVIKPYCQKHGYSFLSGNGTWYMFYIDKNIGRDIPIYPEDLPKRIQNVLEMEIPGDTCNSLGSIMPNYEHLK